MKIHLFIGQKTAVVKV